MHNAAGAYEVKTMGELLPMSFGPEALPARDVLEARMEEKPKTA
jgi:cytidine deaminase